MFHNEKALVIGYSVEKKSWKVRLLPSPTLQTGAAGMEIEIDNEAHMWTEGVQQQSLLYSASRIIPALNNCEGEVLGWDQINNVWLVALIKREPKEVYNKKLQTTIKKMIVRRLTVTDALKELWKVNPEDVLFRYTRDI